MTRTILTMLCLIFGVFFIMFIVNHWGDPIITFGNIIFALGFFILSIWVYFGEKVD